jgi:DNA-binding ferritin-like protein (Dps family)
MFLRLEKEIDKRLKGSTKEREYAMKLKKIIEQLEESEIVFRIRKERLINKSGTQREGREINAKGGETIANKFDVKDGGKREKVLGIDVKVFLGHNIFSDISRLSHELVHAYQFLEGKIGFARDGKKFVSIKEFYDIYDEVEAFKMQSMFANKNDLKKSGRILQNIKEAIESEKVSDSNIKDIINETITVYKSRRQIISNCKSYAKSKLIDNGKRELVKNAAHFLIKYKRRNIDE